MTLQDLKNHRESIIEFASDKGLDLKEFMNSLAEAVEFGLNESEDVMEFVYNYWYYTLAPRSRKTSKVAESRAKAVQDGRMDEFDINRHYAKKNNY